MNDLAGRVALVTGGSGGIGAALCRRLAAAGAQVAIGYGGGGDRAQVLRDELGSDAMAVGGDMADPDVPARMLAEVGERLGPVDVLVPGAGAGERRDIDATDLGVWDATLAVNLRAPFLLVQGALPAMRERGFGRILLLSSVAAFTGGLIGPHYAASKAGLHGLVAFVAGREAAAGITVNAIAPALIEETAMLPGGSDELATRVPVGRLGRPEEVADLALAMLANGYMTGQVVGLDGGMHPR